MYLRAPRSIHSSVYISVPLHTYVKALRGMHSSAVRTPQCAYMLNFINAKWSINQTGMALRFFLGSVINLAPVLMKNEGESLCDSENVYIILKVVIAWKTIADLPPGPA
ncbi:hypothetical protein NDU88_008740 [Pleurodeles waltl]|uniref:Uncharacterized protein n=1 Tax=Pleurodeles waltl TaxID=8319 RepID=A0AAV7QVK4_PLEWA|nr:hypothetical protein NDU88_008740 [Pleurodeles waltl]